MLKARAGIQVAISALAFVLPVACGRPPQAFSPAESTDIARAALNTLFVDREHTRSVLLWTGSLADAPTLGQQRLRMAITGSARGAGAVRLADLDTMGLRLPVPVVAVDPALLDAHFAAHPDGWDTWFRRFPGASGIVELSQPVRRPDARVAMVVARACGEHCHSAWRLVLSTAPDGGWRVDSVIPLPLPRS